MKIAQQGILKAENMKGRVMVEQTLMVSLRTILMYFVILAIFRLMGKREIGELSLLDLVVYVMLAEMAVFVIEEPKRELWEGLVPMVVLTIIQFILAYVTFKNRKLRLLLSGKPSIVITKGKIDEKVMKRLRYNFDDLMMQLREQGVYNLTEVEYAILETSGKMSVIKKKDAKETPLSLPLVLDGEIIEDNLYDLGATREWLLKELEIRGYGAISSISYCSFDKGIFRVDLKDSQ